MAVYSLFLDDERDPPRGPVPRKMWAIARSFSAAVEVCSAWGMPGYVSFDHDLGSGPSGYDFAKWLIEQDMDGRRWPDRFEYAVHSMNPVGAANIDALMKSYIKQRAR